MPRFAILAHDHPSPHWDLFLEAGPVLRSWRLSVPLDPDSPVPAEPAADHRLRYLDYEGPVSDGRGSVTRIDGGSFHWEADEPDRLTVRLAGTRYAGRLSLRRDDSGWSAQFEPD
jgi:hypothetical protein